MFNPITFNKKLRIKIGRHELGVRELPAYQQMALIQLVANEFSKLQRLSKEQATSGYRQAYMTCLLAVWELIKKSTSWWERFWVKRRFFKKALSDIAFFYDVVNEIYNHWQFMGKWLASLARGHSLQMTYGKKSTAYYMNKGFVKTRYNALLLKKLIKGSPVGSP